MNPALNIISSPSFRCFEPLEMAHCATHRDTPAERGLNNIQLAQVVPT